MLRHGAVCAEASNFPKNRRGVALVWVALMGVMLISFVGLAMDAAVVYLGASHLQIAADAAALAAAGVVTDDDPNIPRNAAYTIGHENNALGTPVSLDLNTDNAAGGEIVIGRYHRFENSYCADPPCFIPQLEDANAVRVRARRVTGSVDSQIPLIFGAAPMINVTGVDVSRSATAMRAGGTGAGLITLDPTGDCSLELSGDVVVDLTSAPGWDGDTAVQVNSNDPCAICGDGASLTLIAPETNIVGMDPGYCFNDNATLETYFNPDSPTIPDPLAFLPAPTAGLDLGEIDPNGDLEQYYPPGYYSDGMKVSGSKRIRMGTAMGGSPGIYIFEGTSNGSHGGFQTTGSVSVIATNVMIYMKSGKLDLGGTGETTITPMTEDSNSNATYIGVSIYQARDNPTEARIIGTSNMTLEGTYYFPNNRLEVGGTGIALGNQLIAWQLDLHGTGLFTIQYDGRFPAPGAKVFLVD